MNTNTWIIEPPHQRPKW